MRFDGQTIVVTGGASGIGAAVVQRLTSEGAEIVIADYDTDKANVLVAEAQANDMKVHFVNVDLSSETSIAACGVILREQFGTINALINNAGIVQRAMIEETTHDDWDRQMAINLRAQALITKEILPLMKTNGGAIVNVSSEGAFRGRSDHWVYDASKAGILSLTRSMAVEFSSYGIRVNSVAPGWVVTEMHFGDADEPEAKRQELLSRANGGCLMDRLGRPEEIAAAIAFLCSADASFITGTTLHVDGGQIMR